MYAIVEIAGQQTKVSPKDVLSVPLLDGESGDKAVFENVLMAQNDNKTEIGSPYIPGKVEASIIGHGKGDKVLVFHKKRRKGYQKLNGHRQYYTLIEITGFDIEGFEKIDTEPVALKALTEQETDEAIEKIAEANVQVETDEAIEEIPEDETSEEEETSVEDKPSVEDETIENESEKDDDKQIEGDK